MTSIVTNTSAITALQTLRSINSGLQNTQNRVSSGLRVAKASDNAAYWSIGTTMRSDSSAVSAVSDALGLGAAKVDTAYTGMSSVIDVLSEFKAKLVAAKEDGVDKSKVQDELNQLKQQVESVASSASFNGQNWLNTDISDLHDDTLNESSVVSSFVRSSGGNVSVKSTAVDLSKISLFNGTGYGLLQADPPAAPENSSSSGSGASTDYWVEGNYEFDYTKPVTFSTSDSISFDLVVHPGGGEADVTIPTTITQADVIAATHSDTIANAKDMDSVLNNLWYFSGIPIGVGWSGYVAPDGTIPSSSYQISAENVSGKTDSGIEITNVNSTLPGGANGGLIGSPSSTWRGKFSNSGSSDDGAGSDTPLQIGLLDIDITNGGVDQSLDSVEVMLKRTTDAAARLGSLSSRIDMQMDFANKLKDSIDSGVGRLVDANMEEESSKLSAQQTQQQLAIQSLSMANSAPQTILSLFR